MEHKILTEDGWGGHLDAECDDGSDRVDWYLFAGVSAKPTSNEYYDEIYDTNIWRFYVHFDGLPENRTDCVEGDPWPEEFRPNIRNGESEDDTALYLQNWQPEDGWTNSDVDGSLLEDFVDIIGGVGSRYTGLGSAVLNMFIDSNSVSVNDPDLGADVTWTIPLEGGYDNFPTEENDQANAAEIWAKVASEYADGYHNVKYLPKYEFSYIEDVYYDCNCYDDRYIQRHHKTTAPGSAITASYTALSEPRDLD